MSKALEIAVTTREALTANAAALSPVIEELARRRQREIARAEWLAKAAGQADVVAVSLELWGHGGTVPLDRLALIAAGLHALAKGEEPEPWFF